MNIRLLALMALIGCGDKSDDDDGGGDTGSDGAHCYVDGATFRVVCEEGKSRDEDDTATRE